jgi:hypothetical protein
MTRPEHATPPGQKHATHATLPAGVQDEGYSISLILFMEFP